MSDILGERRKKLLDRVDELDSFYLNKPITYRNMIRLVLFSIDLYKMGIRETDIRKNIV
jgi:hypothetical protein